MVSTAMVIVITLLVVGWIAAVLFYLGLVTLAKRADQVLEQMHEGEAPESTGATTDISPRVVRHARRAEALPLRRRRVG